MIESRLKSVSLGQRENLTRKHCVITRRVGLNPQPYLTLCPWQTYPAFQVLSFSLLKGRGHDTYFTRGDVKAKWEDMPHDRAGRTAP